MWRSATAQIRILMYKKETEMIARVISKCTLKREDFEHLGKNELIVELSKIFKERAKSFDETNFRQECYK
jgi:hypothetical protein